MARHPVVLIGAGPAGLTAAMQLCRQGIQPVVMEKGEVGGLLLNANWVENYPGFVDGVTGPELAALFTAQARRLGVEIQHEQVLSADYSDRTFRIGTNLRELEASILVAATGTRARRLPEEIFSPEIRDRVFTEVFPLLELQGKQVLIIGAGDAAFDYALNLAGRNQITIINRGEEIKALPLLVERTRAHGDIVYQDHTSLLSAEPADHNRIRITTDAKGLESGSEVDIILTAIGRDPDYEFAGPSIINGKDQLLKEERLFLIGDLQNGSFRQTTIAAADGLRAAMSIARILEKGKV